MWANARRNSRPSEYRWCPLFNAAKFGCPLLEYRAVFIYLNSIAGSKPMEYNDKKQ